MPMNRREWIQGGLLAASLGRAALAVGAPKSTVVTLDAQRVLGPAEAIGDLIGSQYEPYTFGFRKPDPWGIEAWREVGFNIGDLALFTYEGSNPYTVSGKIVGIHVARGADGKLQLDFRDFDSNIAFIRDELRVKKIDFTVWGTPKPLADPAAGEFFFFHAPASYSEWSDIVGRAVRHIVQDLRLPGSTYKPWTEPDSGYYYRGRAQPGQIVTREVDPEKLRALLTKQPHILNDYVEKYVNDWRTIKAADPTARVSGTFNVWSKPLKGEAFSLDDFLTRIDQHNRDNPSAPVTVDEIAYQDYNWNGNGLAEGVIGANELVKKHGLPANIPLVLTGWNKDMNKEPNLQRRAAYIVANIIGELVPEGRARTLSRAYIWPFDYDYYGTGIGPVTMPYAAVVYSGDDGSDGPLSIPPITGYHKRPMHAGLKLLAQMKPGQLISASSANPGLKVLATIQPDGHVMLVIANHTDEEQRVTPVLNGTALASRTAQLTVQRVDAAHSADGKGLEPGDRRRVHIDAKGALPALDLPPWSVTGVTVQSV